MNLGKGYKVYFLGIGGIGMSAIARYLRLRGCEVSGYDRTASEVTYALEKIGVKVFHEQAADHLDGAKLMVHTPAISKDSLEYRTALERNIPIVKRAELLGMIGRDYQVLAVAGTHGKTTTCTMLTHLLRTAGIDCTAFLGGISVNLNSNFVQGASSWMVAEADEYDRSFLQLFPQYAVITAMDPDHLDIYGDSQTMIEAYKQFASQVGTATGDTPTVIQAGLQAYFTDMQVNTYGIDIGDYRAFNIRHKGLETTFDFEAFGVLVKDLTLNQPGLHNVSNMVAALAIGSKLGIGADAMRRACQSFQGIHRRFQVWRHTERYALIDDYAHHPVEIAATLSAARKAFPGHQLMAVFQPHLYTRTRDLAQGFAEALSAADVSLLVDIYPARELPIAGVSSGMIHDAILLPEAKKAWISKFDLWDEINRRKEEPVVIVIMGAGDIENEVPLIAQALDVDFQSEFNQIKK